MLIKSLKQVLSLACVVAVMSGCSSTATQSEVDAEAQARAAAEAQAQAEAQAAAERARLAEEEAKRKAEAAQALASTVYFDFDSSMLTSNSRALLLAHAARLKDSGDSVRLEGHADERGTREYNMALGERRAQAVRDFLKLQGVPASQLETVSYGEERPVVRGSYESAYAKNRRVEIK